MEVTEHSKLIYQLSRVSKGPVEYPKNPYLDCGKSFNIWIKRAYKKGYVDIIAETDQYKLYDITSKGQELLNRYPEYCLQNNKSKILFNQEIKR